MKYIVNHDKTKKFIYFSKQHTNENFLKLEFLKLITYYHPDTEIIKSIKNEFVSLSSSQEEAERFVNYIKIARNLSI